MCFFNLMNKEKKKAYLKVEVLKRRMSESARGCPVRGGARRQLWDTCPTPSPLGLDGGQELQ